MIPELDSYNFQFTNCTFEIPIDIYVDRVKLFFFLRGQKIICYSRNPFYKNRKYLVSLMVDDDGEKYWTNIPETTFEDLQIMLAIKPEDVVISEEQLNQILTLINAQLKSGLNAVEVPINTILVQKIKDFYHENWIVTDKEYKTCIKLNFKPREETKIEIGYEV